MSESATNENHHPQGRKKGQAAPSKRDNSPESSASEMVEETKDLKENNNGVAPNTQEDVVSTHFSIITA
jgi:hypothetical protein